MMDITIDTKIPSVKKDAVFERIDLMIAMANHFSVNELNIGSFNLKGVPDGVEWDCESPILEIAFTKSLYCTEEYWENVVDAAVEKMCHHLGLCFKEFGWSIDHSMYFDFNGNVWGTDFEGGVPVGIICTVVGKQSPLCF